MSYSPTLARWMQDDPIGFGDGMNRYQALASNPISHVDSTGTFTLVFKGFTAAEQEKITDAINDVKGRLHFLHWETVNEIQRWKNDPICLPHMGSVIKELESLLDIVDKEAAGLAGKDTLKIEHESLPKKPETQLRQITGPFGGLYIEVNDSGRPGWAAMNDVELRESLMHEMSHIYGTEDDDSKGVMINAHNYQRFYRTDLLLSQTYQGMVMTALQKGAKAGWRPLWNNFLEAVKERQSTANGHSPSVDASGL